MNSTALFQGYASLFNTPDLARDVVRPGAFARSIRERGTHNIRMLYQHNHAEPIGVWRNISEDQRGLAVTGEITLETQRGRETAALLKKRALNGLSIGFHARRSQPAAQPGARILFDIDLIEISIVTFPMHPSARVQMLSTQEENTNAQNLAAQMRLAARCILKPNPTQTPQTPRRHLS